MSPNVPPLAVAAALLAGGALASLVFALALRLGGRPRVAVPGARRLARSSRPLPWLARRSGLSQDALRSLRQELPGRPAVPAAPRQARPVAGPAAEVPAIGETVAAGGFRAALGHALGDGMLLAERGR